MSKNLPMYTAIHHDRFNDLVFAWYTDETREAVQVHHRCYTSVQGQYGAMPCEMRDIFGNPVYEIVTTGKREMDIRIANSGTQNMISECDIDFRTRWLEEHYKDTEDFVVNMDDFNICFFDIEVATEGRFATAEKAERPINCVTIYFSKYKKYYTFGSNREIKPETQEKLRNENCEYINCRNEADLLTQLFKKIGDTGADFLSGWNSDYYDMPYIIKRAALKSVSLKLLSRLPEKYKTAYISKRTEKLVIGGTEVIDFLLLYKKFKVKEEDDFKLETIGKAEVGETKADLPDGYMSYIKYWDDFVWYNFMDVRLMVKIEEKCRMFETAVTACAEARVPLGSIFEVKKIEVGFLLSFLHRKNIVMPPLKENAREGFPGAYVYATAGYYINLLSYDYRSQYPSFIMGANVSPETKVLKIDGKFLDAIGRELDVKEEDLVRSPWTANGTKEVFYRRDVEGIIPQITKKIFDGRTALKNKMKAAKKAGNYDLADVYDMKQKAYKIFGNGLYGLLGNPYFQFYDIDNSATITSFGQKLIRGTNEDLCKYFEHDFENDERFYNAFGFKPTLDKSLVGTYINADDMEMYRRLSHGDTDSFFVKFDDVYSPFKQWVDKSVQVVVFKGNEMISKETYDLSTQEKDSKIEFNKKCIQYASFWKDLPNDEKAQAFKEGIVMDNDYRIIYNRFCLTDFCRIFDAIMMEDILADIMKRFAEQWNFMENTLFLKREKCVVQAIVTSRKKYICNVESDEDVKIFDEKKKFKTTGIEIVRSSTTPFARKYILQLVKDLLKTMDKTDIKEKYMKIKKEFFEIVESGKIYDIAIPSGIKHDPPNYAETLNWPIEERKKVDWRLRGPSVWNHLIETDEVLKKTILEPIYAGSKVKYLKVTKNKYGLKAMSFVGNECPERIKELFNINWQEQWTKTFAQVMDRLFVAVGWQQDFENDEREIMAELF